MIRLTFCLFAVGALPALSAAPPVVVVNAVTDLYRPLPFDQQKLTGLLGERMRANSEGYLEHVNPAASPSEAAGKFLDAAANAYEYRHDQDLRTLMDRVAKELLTVQRTNGLLARKYDLLGLLAYYRITGDESAFAASKKAADLLISEYTNEAGNGEGLTGILLEPLVYLYRYTGNERYLQFCRSLAESPIAFGESASPHERISTLVGLVELYRITGDASYYRTAVAAWRNLRDTRLSLSAMLTSTGQEATIPDPCVVVSWMQLTLDLLRLTGEAQYGEELERIVYNQLFAAQDPKTGAVFTSVPLKGSKKVADTKDECAPSEAQGISLLPSAAWGRYGNGIAIVLYGAARGTFQLRRRGAVQLYAEATYPETGEILLHVDPAHNIQFPLRLRVPEWTNNFTVDIAGSHLIGKRGEFLTISRQWKRGDTVKIAIDMTVHAITGGDAESIAIQRGPQILALDKTLNPQVKDLRAASIASAVQLKLTSADVKLPSTWTGDQAYTAPGEYDRKPQQLVLVPVADALTYELWIQKAGRARDQ